MQIEDDKIQETPEEARQGENIRGMTSVLGLSIAGVVIVLGLVLGAFLASQAGWF